MSNTNQFSYAPWNYFGEAAVFAVDPNRSPDDYEYWHYMGRVMNPTVTPEITKVQRRHRFEDLNVEVGERITDASCTFEFGLTEPLNPEVLQLVLNDSENTLTITAAAVGHQEFTDPLYFNARTGAGLEKKLPWGGFTKLSQLPAPSNFVGTVSATGGSGWSTGGTPDYYAWVTGYWKRPGEGHPTIGAISAVGEVDTKFVLGTPWDETAGTAGYQGEPVDFALADDKVSFAITDTTLSHTALPDGYIIWMNTTNDLSTATAVAVDARDTSGTTTIVVTALGAGDTFTQGIGATFHYNTGTLTTPSWTALTINTDFTWDRDRGVIKPVAGGAIASGQNVRVSYFYVNSRMVEASFGPTGVTSDYRTFHVLCIGTAEDGADPLYPEGAWLTVHKANSAGLAVPMNFPSGEYYDSQPVSMRCLADSANSSKFYRVRTMSPALEAFAQEHK